jgi:exopolysaccharide biosynthesis polyprenyl glycosylphosphotransferase
MKTGQISRITSISTIERRWLLIIIDLLAINGGFLLALELRGDYDLSGELMANHPIWFVLLSGLWLFWGYLFRIYDLQEANSVGIVYPKVLGVGLLTVLNFNLIPYLAPTLPPSRFPLFISIALPVLFLGAGRAVYIIIFSQQRFKRRVAILGAGWAGKTIYKAIHHYGQSIYQVVGFFDDDPYKSDKPIVIQMDETEKENQQNEAIGVHVLGASHDLLSMVSRGEISTIVLAITHDIQGELYQVLSDCLRMEVEIIPMPLLYEQLTGKVPVQHIGDHWSVAMPLEHPGTKLVWHAVKRLFDLFWAGVGLVFLAVLFPFLALAIYLDSPGPIFYRQKRMGRNEEVFWVYKFRSMIPDAEQGEAVWAEEEDPRVTRVGKLMRKTHLDEFPQFLNILKGEMSVVGPRPERPEFIEELAEEIPFYRVRLAVKPGMAGWGLIHQGYGASVEDALEKLQYDLYYIKHQSLGLDMYILFRTFWDTISFSGR